MKIHYSKVVAIDKTLTLEMLESKLKSMDRYDMKDGIRVVKVLRGRRNAGVTND